MDNNSNDKRNNPQTGKPGVTNPTGDQPKDAQVASPSGNPQQTGNQDKGGKDAGKEGSSPSKT